MGGLLAYDVAARGGGVAGVVATCLLDPADRQALRVAVRRAAAARILPVLQALDLVLGRLRVPIRLVTNMGAIANNAELVGALIADRAAAGTTVPVRHLTSFLGSTRPVQPERSTTPLLLVHPGDDRWTPPTVSLRFLQRVDAPTRYVELDNCGHLPIEPPGVGQMQQAFTEFLADVAATAQSPAAGDDDRPSLVARAGVGQCAM